MGSASKAFNNMLFAAVLTASMVAVVVSGFQFEVGENMGWRKPTGKEPETYNEWAARNRFHIGDSVHFKYRKDSVLVVSSADYLTCNKSNPISKFDDGNTVFQFDHSGFFYFISGQPGNCESGERLIIRVMHPSEVEAPELAPSPSAGGNSGWNSDNWGPPGVISSSIKLSVVSYFMTVVAALCVMVCLFV
ncbi:hypothetical protein BUALT_Bualt18G0075100 [Buddleja alternifolia]|uniref:Phytocyanin domain-containing protein n=1 Tax=Buddleja alternifolia TaxID=168488 RepID=A0AAV6W9D5_9LAMI|nr:hypothetical protein BUALT_Bualt18G0075100 [Buddleja alternifolia]